MTPQKKWLRKREKQWWRQRRSQWDSSQRDLSEQLQRLEQRKYPKLKEFGIVLRGLLLSSRWIWGTSLVVGGIFLWLNLSQFPWHWQLFVHWLKKEGDITEIPFKLHEELRELCQHANTEGIVNGYLASTEIAYSLGNFECQYSRFDSAWIIKDTYGFERPEEAAGGTQVAELLVELWGTEYSYEIRAIIPVNDYSSLDE